MKDIVGVFCKVGVKYCMLKNAHGIHEIEMSLKTKKFIRKYSRRHLIGHFACINRYGEVDIVMN